MALPTAMRTLVLVLFVLMGPGIGGSHEGSEQDEDDSVKPVAFDKDGEDGGVADTQPDPGPDDPGQAGQGFSPTSSPTASSSASQRAPPQVSNLFGLVGNGVCLDVNNNNEDSDDDKSADDDDSESDNSANSGEEPPYCTKLLHTDVEGSCEAACLADPACSGFGLEDRSACPTCTSVHDCRYYVTVMHLCPPAWTFHNPGGQASRDGPQSFNCCADTGWSCYKRTRMDTHDIDNPDVQFVMYDVPSLTSNLSHIGKGVTVGDVNGDGDLDVYIVQSGAANILMLNMHGNGAAWVDAAASASVEDEAGQGRAAIFADFDQDGALDIYVTNAAGYNRLYMQLAPQSDGLPRFVEVAQDAGVSDEVANGHGAVVLDYNNDGLLDIYVANINRLPNRLFQQLPPDECQAAGHSSVCFNEVAVNAYVDEMSTYMGDSRGVAAADLNGDGSVDLAVAMENPGGGDQVSSHGQRNLLYLNDGPPPGVAQWAFDFASSDFVIQTGTNENPSRGVAFGDFNNDGHADMYYSNYKNSDDEIYVNLGPSSSPRFSHRDNSVVVSGYTQRPNTGVAWGDFNNDGKLDLALSNIKANVPLVLLKQQARSLDQAQQTGAGLYINQWESENEFVTTALDSQLYRNGGLAADGAQQTAPELPTLGVVWADLDMDGDLDLVAAETETGSVNGFVKTHRVFFNTQNPPAGTWLALVPLLVGADNVTSEQLFAATVVVKPLLGPTLGVDSAAGLQSRVVDGGSGDLSQLPYQLHVAGLNASRGHRVSIHHYRTAGLQQDYSFDVPPSSRCPQGYVTVNTRSASNRVLMLHDSGLPVGLAYRNAASMRSCVQCPEGYTTQGWGLGAAHCSLRTCGTVSTFFHVEPRVAMSDSTPAAGGPNCSSEWITSLAISCGPHEYQVSSGSDCGTLPSSFVCGRASTLTIAWTSTSALQATKFRLIHASGVVLHDSSTQGGSGPWSGRSVVTCDDMLPLPASSTAVPSISPSITPPPSSRASESMPPSPHASHTTTPSTQPSPPTSGTASPPTSDTTTPSTSEALRSPSPTPSVQCDQGRATNSSSGCQRKTHAEYETAAMAIVTVSVSVAIVSASTATGASAASGASALTSGAGAGTSTVVPTSGGAASGTAPSVSAPKGAGPTSASAAVLLSLSIDTFQFASCIGMCSHVPANAYAFSKGFRWSTMEFDYDSDSTPVHADGHNVTSSSSSSFAHTKTTSDAAADTSQVQTDEPSRLDGVDADKALVVAAAVFVALMGVLAVCGVLKLVAEKVCGCFKTHRTSTVWTVALGVRLLNVVYFPLSLLAFFQLKEGSSSTLERALAVAVLALLTCGQPVLNMAVLYRRRAHARQQIGRRRSLRQKDKLVDGTFHAFLADYAPKQRRFGLMVTLRKFVSAASVVLLSGLDLALALLVCNAVYLVALGRSCKYSTVTAWRTDQGVTSARIVVAAILVALSVEPDTDPDTLGLVIIIAEALSVAGMVLLQMALAQPVVSRVFMYARMSAPNEQKPSSQKSLDGKGGEGGKEGDGDANRANDDRYRFALDRSFSSQRKQERASTLRASRAIVSERPETELQLDASNGPAAV